MFLDRDGVINLNLGHVHRRQDFHFQEGIFPLCRAAQDLGYLVVVVTNQAGIARGYYTEAQFLGLTTWMVGVFAGEGIEIRGVYYCPYHPDGVGEYRCDSLDRKPKPGMLHRAAVDFGVNLQRSVLIGDQWSDIEAAMAAGVGTRILLGRGEGGECGKGVTAHYTAGSLGEIRHRFFGTVS